LAVLAIRMTRAGCGLLHSSLLHSRVPLQHLFCLSRFGFRWRLYDFSEQVRCGKWLILIRRHFHHGFFQHAVIFWFERFFDLEMPCLFHWNNWFMPLEHSLFHKFINAKPKRESSKVTRSAVGRTPTTTMDAHIDNNHLLDSNHGYHTDQSRWKTSIKGSNSLFSKDPYCAIHNALVGILRYGTTSLCYKSCLDCILKESIRQQKIC
jgi:hypothetical protein